MLERITKPNSLWVADLCFLTRRFAYSVMTKRRFNEDLPKMDNGAWHKKGLKKNPTFYPKWSRYAFKGLDKFKELNSIPIYDRPIVLFAVQDVASRFIIHACLKQSPIEFVNKSYGFPHWFKLDDCFQKALIQLPFPSHLSFAMDSDIYHSYYKKILLWNWNWQKDCFPIGKETKFLGSTLESFFSRIQYEFREDLTQENLDRWIYYYNFERPHSALKGNSPSQYYLS